MIKPNETAMPNDKPSWSRSKLITICFEKSLLTKTAASGKRAARASRNACKSDYAERMEMKQIRCYLRTQKSYTDLLKFFIKQHDNIRTPQIIAINLKLNFLENELIAQEAKLRSGIGIKNNIIPFPNAPP